MMEYHYWIKMLNYLIMILFYPEIDVYLVWIYRVGIFLFFLENKKNSFSNSLENRISAWGVQHFLKAVQYQEVFIKLNLSTRNSSTNLSPVIPNQGLLRLELQVRFNRLRKTKRIYFFFFSEMIFFQRNAKLMKKFNIY